MAGGGRDVNGLTWLAGARQVRLMSMPRIIASLAEISDAYDAILCDVWGVLHDGKRAFPAASDALVAYRKRGGQVALITNAPRPIRRSRRNCCGSASAATPSTRSSPPAT